MDPNLFDPEAIRGVLESGITNIFLPNAHIVGATYEAGEYVESNGRVYKALRETTTTPNSADWDDQGLPRRMLYDNVESTIPTGGGLRMSIAWGAPEDKRIPCVDGSHREIDGVLTVWSYTPVNLGTRPGLLDMMRLREGLQPWSRRQCNGTTPLNRVVKVTDLNGPRNAGPAVDVDYFTHVLTATLTAYEVY
jgi:hypothetical protein